MELSGWRKYSLPHILHLKYKMNTDSTISTFSGDSYFLAHVTDCDNIAEATLIFSYILAAPFLIFNWLVALLMMPVFWIGLSTTLAIIDSYCKIKFRRRIKFKNTLSWMFDPEAPKKHRPWHLR